MGCSSTLERVAKCDPLLVHVTSDGRIVCTQQDRLVPQELDKGLHCPGNSHHFQDIDVQTLELWGPQTRGSVTLYMGTPPYQGCVRVELDLNIGKGYWNSLLQPRILGPLSDGFLEPPDQRYNCVP